MKMKQVTALLFSSLLGIVSFAAIAQPYTISANGSEVTDQKTGLIWRRCSEGMNWDGTTCAGTATTFTHEAALTQAASQAVSTGVAWRLPNVKELTSIADKTRSFPAIDTTAFPATPFNLQCWSSSPLVGDSTSAWFIQYSNGVVVYAGRGTSFYVRLVRTGQ